MKEDNIVLKKSFNFSLRIIKLYKFLRSKNEFVISNQLLRSGTSIGANVEEAVGGVSKKDFINKITIAYKEARESSYWIKLLGASGYLNHAQYSSILSDCDELLKILGKIQISSKNDNS
jgi:four helix bundle protein